MAAVEILDFVYELLESAVMGQKTGFIKSAETLLNEKIEYRSIEQE